MTGPNDFFLTFGSNAKDFSDDLKRDLAPARTEITSFLNLLGQLDGKSATIRELHALNLTGGGNKPNGGGGGNGSSASNQEVDRAAKSALDSLGKAASELETVITSLSGVGKAIKDLPEVVKAAMKSARLTVAGVERDQLGLHDRNEGGEFSGNNQSNLLLPGTPAFDRLIAQSVAAGSNARPNQTRQPQHLLDVQGARELGRILSIPAVSSSSIDSGAADRIVNGISGAIQFQTRVLLQGLRGKNVGGGGTGGGGAPSKGGGKSKSGSAAPVTSVDEVVAAAEQPEKDIAKAYGKAISRAQVANRELRDRALNELENLHGAERESMEQFIFGLDRENAQFAADMEKLQTRKGRKDIRRRIASGEKPLPISEADKADADRRRDLIALAADPDLATNIGRGTGKVGRGQLQEMIAAFQASGISVPGFNKKLKQEQLVPLVQGAKAEYDALYGPGGDPSLDTRGRQVLRDTKIADGLRQLLGGVTDAQAAEIAILRDLSAQVVSADRLGGGTGPGRPSLGFTGGLAQPGTIAALSRQKGRRGFGSGLGDVYSEEQLLKAEADLAKAYEAEASLVRKNLRSPDFNPYDPELYSQIQGGNTEEAKQQARGFRTLLAAQQRATKAIDELGKEYLLNERALEENRGFIERASARIESGTQKPDDEVRLAGALEEQYRLQNRQRALTSDADGSPNGLRQLFESEGYKLGLSLREGVQRSVDLETGNIVDLTPSRTGVPFNPDYSAREGLERLREIQDERRQNQAANRAALVEGTARTIAGVRTAIGSSQVIRNIPGLSVAGKGGQARLVVQDPDSLRRPGRDVGKEIQELQRTFRSFVSSQDRAFAYRLDPTKAESPEAITKAETRLENKGVALANKLQELFGVAPRVDDLIGRRLQNPDNIASERGRQDVRDRLEADRLRKFTATPQKAAADTRAKLERAEKHLAQAQEELATGSEALDRATDELTANTLKLSKKKQQEVVDAERAVPVLRREREAIENRTSDSVVEGDIIPTEQRSDVRSLRATLDKLNARLATLQEGGRPDDDGTPQAARNIAAFERNVAGVQTAIARNTQALEQARANAAANPEREQLSRNALDLADVDARLNAALRTRDQIAPSLAATPEQAERVKKLRDERAAILAGNAALVARISAARDEGDLRENSAYDEAKNEQGQAAARLRAIDAELSKIGVTGLDVYEQMLSNVTQAERAVEGLDKQVKKLREDSTKADKKAAAADERDAALKALPPEVRDAVLRVEQAEADLAAAKRQVSTAQSRVTALTNQGVTDSRLTEAQEVLATRQAESPALIQRREADLARQKAELDQIIQRTATYDAVYGPKRPPKAGAGDGGAGDDGTTKAPPGPDDGDESILAKILAQLQATHNLLKSGKALVGTGGGSGGFANQKVISPQRKAQFEAERAQLGEQLGGASNNREAKAYRSAANKAAHAAEQNAKESRRLGKENADALEADAAALRAHAQIVSAQYQRYKALTAELNTSIEAGTTPSTSRVRNPSAREIELSKSSDPADLEEAAELQRIREAAYRGGKNIAGVQTQAITEDAKMTAKARQELLAKVQVDQQAENTLRLLNKATLEQVEALRKLARQEDLTEEQARELAAAQVEVYRSIQRDLGGQGVGASGRDQAARSVLTSVGGADPGSLANIKRTAQSVDGFHIIDETFASGVPQGGLFGEQSLFTQRMFGNTGFWSRVMNTTGTFVVRNFAAGFVFGMTAALQDVIFQAIETEATFIKVSAALESTGKDVGNLRGDLASISTDYGVALNDVYDTAAGLTGIFDNAEDLAAGTRVVSQLQAISRGALNAQEATGVLASTVAAFGRIPGEQLDITDKILPGGVEGVEKVADVLTVVQNTLGVNVETTAEGVGRMAGLARQMKISFEETAVFTAQIAKQTNQTGAAAGEQFSRIVGALQTGRGRKAVTDAFGPVAEGQLAQGDYGAVFKTIVAGYADLDDAQKRNLVVSLAGQRQAASFLALVNDAPKTLDALTRAEAANGEAAERLDKLMETLQGRLAKVRTNVQNLASNLVRSGILDFLGLMLIAADKMLSVINAVLNGFNDLADNNSFLGFMRQVIALMLGAAISVKLFQAAFRGIKGSIEQITPQALRDANARRAQERAGAVASGTYRPVDRPRYSTFGVGGVRPGYADTFGVAPGGPQIRRAPLVRGLAFGVDRTIGVGAEALGRATQTGAKKILASERDASGKITRSLNNLGNNIVRGAQGFRTRVQNFGDGSSRLRPSNFLAAGAASRLQAAEELRNRAAYKRDLYARQQQYASYTGPTAAANQANYARRTGTDPALLAGGPNPNLLKQADEFEKTARGAERAAGRMGKLSSGLSRLAASGALADGAMIAATLALTAFFEHARAESEAEKTVDKVSKSAKDRIAGDARTEEEKAAEAYIGPASEKMRELTQEADKFSLGLRGAFAVGKGLLTGQGINESIDKEFGLEGSNILLGDGGSYAGLDDAQKAYQQYMKQLDEAAERAGATGTDVVTQGSNIQRELDKALVEIEKSDLTESQKLAAQAAMEQVKAEVQTKTANLAAMLNGLNATVSLTADQIKSLDELTNVVSAAGGASTIGDLDLSDIYSQLRGDVGAQEGSIVDRSLGRLTGGDLDDVGVAMEQIKLARAKVIDLNTQYRTKLADSPDEAEPIRGQLLSALQEYTQVHNRALDAITAQAQVLGQYQINTGDYAGGIRTYTRSLKRITKIIEKEEQNNEAAIRERLAAVIANINSDPEAYNDLMAKLPGIRQRQLARLLPKRQKAVATFKEQMEAYINRRTRRIDLQIAKTDQADQELLAQLRLHRARVRERLYRLFNRGEAPEGSNLDYGAANYGNEAVTADDLGNVTQEAAQAETDAAQSSLDRAKQARDNALAIREAQLGVLSAYADARGDAVAVARLQVQVAQAQIAAARVDLANAKTNDQKAQAQIAILNAQAALIAAHAQVQAAQAALISSRFDVAIALAEAAGKTVEAARLKAAQARAALKEALKRSNGEKTAEVNQARAAAIAAQAALRDARLQDDLDTIDFNLQMGRITQASAIAALQEILRTRELTREQRRQLLLQIKGMKDELADSQFNFGNIKLPTPYQVRRYVAERRAELAESMQRAAASSIPTGVGSGPGPSVSTQTIIFDIDGADIAQVKRVISEVVGTTSGTRTRTTGSRRGR